MSSLSELTERFQKTPTQNKVLALLLITGVFGAGFYFMFYSDMMADATRLVRKQRELEQKKASYEEQKQKYMAFRAEVKKLLQEKKELVKVLPTVQSSFFTEVSITGSAPSFLMVLWSRPTTRSRTLTVNAYSGRASSGP